MQCCRIASRFALTLVAVEENKNQLIAYQKASYKRVFGPNVPDRCVRIPAFGGFYRPDQHPVVDVQLEDVASRVSCAQSFCLSIHSIRTFAQLLVALALEFTDIVFAPQLPDLVMILLSFLDEATAFAIGANLYRFQTIAYQRI